MHEGIVVEEYMGEKVRMCGEECEETVPSVVTGWKGGGGGMVCSYPLQSVQWI